MTIKVGAAKDWYEGFVRFGMTTWRNMDGGGRLGEQVGSKPAEAKAEPCSKGLMWPVSAQVTSQNIHGLLEYAKSARAYRGDDTIALTG